MNNQTKTLDVNHGEQTTRIFTEQSPIINGTDINNIHVTQNIKGATPEQLDEIIAIMRQQSETANIHAKIIAKMMKVAI